MPGVWSPSTHKGDRSTRTSSPPWDRCALTPAMTPAMTTRRHWSLLSGRYRSTSDRSTAFPAFEDA